MSLTAIAAIFAAAAVVIAISILLARLAAQQAEIRGRLAQMAEGQAAAQAQAAERLQSQERILTRNLEERLTAFSQRIGQTLEKSAVQAQTSMTDLKERLAVIDAAQRNITELSGQVVGLQDILSNKQKRGEFGEIQLHDLVTNALPPSAYSFQETLGNGRRADCLLKLPNPPGSIVVDSKFPLESYRALRAATDDASRKEAAKRFTTDIQKHVDDISEKYIVPGETADCALMFLPSEAVFAELHAGFPEIVERAHRARVYTVSPTTLWATLNTIRAILKDVRMREQAGVIQHQVAAMMQDVVRLDGRVENLQKHFDLAVRDVQEIRTSASKIVGHGERIAEVEFEKTESPAAAIAAPIRRIGND